MKQEIKDLIKYTMFVAFVICLGIILGLYLVANI